MARRRPDQPTGQRLFAGMRQPARDVAHSEGSGKYSPGRAKAQNFVREADELTHAEADRPLSGGRVENHDPIDHPPT
jgi:hypothetical protein